MSKDKHKIFSVGKIDLSSDMMKGEIDPTDLPLLTTRDMVLFPGVTVPISLGRDASRATAQAAYDGSVTIGIFCQKNPDVEQPELDDVHNYGVTARVLQLFDLPDGGRMAIVHALDKVRITGHGAGKVLPQAPLSAAVKKLSETDPRATDTEFQALVAGLSQTVAELAGSGAPMSELEFNIKTAESPRLLVNLIATHAPFPPDFKMELMAQTRVKERAFKLMAALNRDSQRNAIYKDVMERTKAMIDEQQRKNILRAQLDTIKEELYGEDEEIKALREDPASEQFPEAVAAVFSKELEKLERIPQNSPDYSIQHTYLRTLLELPWSNRSEDNTDFALAEEMLESEHYGLEKVKERILEQLAVIMNAPDGHAPILCLVGAPGVGKTSLGCSIARAMGRKYERVALGGLHDEAEIRGHRRTYIGAMPGRIIAALKRAGTSNPVILLDEIDKIGSDYRGDPSAALLEVLDPEQNHRFHDNYIDLDFDLSKVLFIATANTLQSVSQPLLDRMEIIDISGYLLEEKLQIASRHLLPRLRKSLGLPDKTPVIDDEAVTAIIEQYTSESGVRQLEKRLAAVLRKAVLAKMRRGSLPPKIEASMLADYLGVAPFTKDRYEGNEFPGVVTGLAWTSAGGEILFIEASTAPGKSERPSLTGNLGDVMKESAIIALQYVKAHAAELGLTTEQLERALHIHVPEGAIPKDGPSAGITMAVAILSALSGRKVRPKLAMTGEITLRGKVLPVGGIKEKILAAKRAGITTIILCKANRKDVEDIKEDYRRGLEFIYVDTVSEVFAASLL